ncbi:MAG: bifunctional UDP-N-acetylglucosamine diphosphorylase/glucosamine-1-phosphate N-acetyltransferase GlmU [candidate division WS1 bacterium]|nr:bifunctional UDP-N-acetylglucosamine diphosphorylase/glucosamine-1-phosphate N-acetyltransferase GlmU [candidate division WS1 bacterium]
MSQLASIVLAAGLGTRMKSQIPKPLHRLCGQTMLNLVLSSLRPLGPDPQVVVVGQGAEQVRQSVSDPAVVFAVQEQQLGTGDAAKAARGALAEFEGDIVVTCGDIPLVRTETWERMLSEHHRQGAACTLVTAAFQNPQGYGRIIRHPADPDLVLRIAEEPRGEEVEIREGNVSVYCFRAEALWEALEEIRDDNLKGEYYLTDAVEILVSKGMKVAAVMVEEATEVIGINDRATLARAEAVLRSRINHRLMLDGVTMVDPATTYVDVGVEVGPDTILYPGTILRGETTVAEGCVIGPHVVVEDCHLGAGTVVKAGSVVRESVVGERVQIGPNAHVRDHSTLEEQVRVGTGSEVCRSRLGAGTKDLHFSYLGDATVGAGANIGAGAITCNYDGEKKNPTLIEDGAFVGSDAALIAPVTIGAGSFVAAGSVISKDVPPGALGVSRAAQRIKEGWAEKRTKKKS